MSVRKSNGKMQAVCYKHSEHLDSGILEIWICKLFSVFFEVVSVVAASHIEVTVIVISD